MKGKKLLSLLLAAVLSMSLFLFTACSGQQTPQNPGPQIEQGGGTGGGTGDDPGTSGGSGDDTGSGGSEEVPPPAHVHSAQHTAAVAPTCTTAGNVDYWYCAGCNKYFSDEDCTEEIKGGVTLPAEHKNVDHVTKKEATCNEAGNKEYYHCNDCGKYFADSDYQIDITGDITLPAGHKNVEHVTRHEATCTEAGNKDYYHCNDCGKYFADSDYQIDITGDITLPAGHKFPEAYETSETEHWRVCDECGTEQRGEHVYSSSNECDICGYTLQFTEGLKYTNIDENTCRVTGIGTATAETDIIIPVVYDGRKVVKIDYQAFKGCSGIASITIPASVTSIGNYAFYECSNLTSITIPASVTSISDEVFYGCSSLERIDVAPGNTTYSSQDGILYNYDKTEIICVPRSKQSATIPASVTSIGIYAFYGCINLQTVTFANPDGWKVSQYRDMRSPTTLSSEQLQDGTTAANYLKSTYRNYYWQRS